MNWRLPTATTTLVIPRIALTPPADAGALPETFIGVYEVSALATCSPGGLPCQALPHTERLRCSRS